MDQLRKTIIQTNLEWKNPLKNRACFSEIINNLNEPIHLIVLPEMFTTGFSMNPRKSVIPETQWLSTPREKWLARQFPHDNNHHILWEKSHI